MEIVTKIHTTDIGFFFDEDCDGQKSGNFITFSELQAANLLYPPGSSANYRVPARQAGDEIIALAERIKCERASAALKVSSNLLARTSAR